MGNIENTVPAKDQMINATVVSFLGEENAPLRILIVGNSITRHGPKADIGWERDWGMAASAPEKDYVHRLYAKLTESGKNVYMRIRQASYWELNFSDPDCLSAFAGDRDFKADIVIFRLGENVAEKDGQVFENAVREFVNYLCPEGGRVIFTSSFWGNPLIDNAVAAVAKELGSPCATITAFDEGMMAIGQFAHRGVSVHPGDEGMEMIASRIFECM